MDKQSIGEDGAASLDALLLLKDHQQAHVPQQGKRRLSLERLRGSADTVKINNAIASKQKTNLTTATTDPVSAMTPTTKTTQPPKKNSRLSKGEDPVIPTTKTTTKPMQTSSKREGINAAPSPTKPYSSNHDKKDVRSQVKKASRPVTAPAIHPTKNDSYWTVTTGRMNRVGHTCRECRQDIIKNDAIVVRDGRLSRLFYHVRCYSGNPDPRTQKNSSYHNPRYNDRLGVKAPTAKGKGFDTVKVYGYRGSGPLSITPSLAPYAASRYELKTAAAVKRKGTSSVAEFPRITPPIIVTHLST